MRNTDDINFRAGGGGIGFLGCLQIVFIILKLCHVIDWRWVIVLIPLWIELGLCALVLAIVLIWIFMEI
jgi:hypothetical protein